MPHAILLSILTGMRVDEICALKWEDVNFEKGEIHIHRQQLKEHFANGTANIYRDVDYTKNEKGVS